MIIADFAKQAPALVSDGFIAKAPIRLLTTKVPERAAKYRNLSAVVVSDEDLQREGMSAEASLEWARNAVAHGVTESVVLTLGPNGCILVSAERVIEIAAVQRPVHNTSGAGDTFVAGLAKSLLSDTNMISACRFANRLASQSVGDLATGIAGDPSPGH